MRSDVFNLCAVHWHPLKGTDGSGSSGYNVYLATQGLPRHTGTQHRARQIRNSKCGDPRLWLPCYSMCPSFQDIHFISSARVGFEYLSEGRTGLDCHLLESFLTANRPARLALKRHLSIGAFLRRREQRLNQPVANHNYARLCCCVSAEFKIIPYPVPPRRINRKAVRHKRQALRLLPGEISKSDHNGVIFGLIRDTRPNP